MLSGVTITVAISQLPLLKSIFETGFCQYLGRISFMLYLVHMNVFELLGKYWKRMLVNMMPKTDDGAYAGYFEVYVVYFGFWVVMMPIVLVVAGQVTKYVDDPSVRFAKWLETKFIEDDEKEGSIPLSSLPS